MTDEPKRDQPEEIESILSDLDAILSPESQAANPTSKVEPIPPPQPAVEAPITSTPTPAPQPRAEVSAPPPTIELAPRAGMIKPPEKTPGAPKPVPKLPDQKPIELSVGPTIPAEALKSPPTPIEPPKVPAAPIEPPKIPVPVERATPPAVPVEPLKMPSEAHQGAELPPDAPKEQVRRVAYIYTSSCVEIKTSFAAFLSQAAKTISKKPLFLREVMSYEVGVSSDPKAALQKAQQMKAAAILAVVEDWPSVKVDELSEACSRANLLFRAVAPAEAQKKSTAVDIIVDMMLLPGEG